MANTSRVPQDDHTADQSPFQRPSRSGQGAALVREPRLPSQSSHLFELGQCQPFRTSKHSFLPYRYHRLPSCISAVVEIDSACGARAHYHRRDPSPIQHFVRPRFGRFKGFYILTVIDATTSTTSTPVDATHIADRGTSPSSALRSRWLPSHQSTISVGAYQSSSISSLPRAQQLRHQSSLCRAVFRQRSPRPNRVVQRGTTHECRLDAARSAVADGETEEADSRADGGRRSTAEAPDGLHLERRRIAQRARMGRHS